jgi:hypothetical protein
MLENSKSPEKQKEKPSEQRRKAVTSLCYGEKNVNKRRVYVKGTRREETKANPNRSVLFLLVQNGLGIKFYMWTEIFCFFSPRLLKARGLSAHFSPKPSKCLRIWPLSTTTWGISRNLANLPLFFCHKNFH